MHKSLIINSKTPLASPEGVHGELAFRVSLQIDIMTEQLY